MNEWDLFYVNTSPQQVGCWRHSHSLRRIFTFYTFITKTSIKFQSSAQVDRLSHRVVTCIRYYITITLTILTQNFPHWWLFRPVLTQNSPQWPVPSLAFHLLTVITQMNWFKSQKRQNPLTLSTLLTDCQKSWKYFFCQTVERKSPEKDWMGKISLEKEALMRKERK